MVFQTISDSRAPLLSIIKGGEDQKQEQDQGEKKQQWLLLNL
jgi:hypothetical protein